MDSFEEESEWLGSFWAEYRSDFPGDCLATTYATCGAIMVAAARLRTRSINLITALINLPVGFVSEALISLEELEHSLHAELLDLENAASREKKDYRKVRDSLEFLMERFWMATDDSFADRMRSERCGILVGGKSQDWLDEEDLKDFLGGLSDIKVRRKRRVRRCPRRLL